MATATGFFDNSGSPTVKIGISGVIQRQPAEFDALIDTGFVGFVSMPMFAAFPLGLVLVGTVTAVLADGSTANKLTAQGTVWLGAESQSGVIMLETGSAEVLLGMDFLRIFRKRLIVSHNQGVILEDD
jgi:predicted aspartyl protease